MPTLQHNIYQLCKLLLQNIKIYLVLVLLIVLKPTGLAPYTTQNHGCCSIFLTVYKDLQKPCFLFFSKHLFLRVPQILQKSSILQIFFIFQAHVSLGVILMPQTSFFFQAIFFFPSLFNYNKLGNFKPTSVYKNLLQGMNLLISYQTISTHAGNWIM